MHHRAVPAAFLAALVTTSCAHEAAHTSPTVGGVVTESAAKGTPEAHLEVARKALHTETSWGSPPPAHALTAVVRNPKARLPHPGRTVLAASEPLPRRTSTPMTPAASTHLTDCAKVKCIALTFDDGPGPYTQSILDTLDKKKAKASFFVLGPAAQAAPGTVRRMAQLGMGVGDHSWSHPQFTHLSKDKVTSEITRTADVIKKILGTAPFAVRPPYGDHDKATPHAGYPFVLWDVDTEDWKNRNVQVTTKRALDGAHRGAIVLMHDIHPTTAKALPGLIDALRKQGYTFVTVGDIAPHMSKDGVYSSGDVKK